MAKSWPAAGRKFASGDDGVPTKYLAHWVKPNGDSFLRKMELPGTSAHESVAQGLRKKGFKLQK